MEGAVFEVRIYFARKRSSQRRKEISPKKNFAEGKFHRIKFSPNWKISEIMNSTQWKLSGGLARGFGWLNVA